MTAAELVARLDGVRNTRPGSWIARCPAHTDRTPSLAITETSDGTVLLHDFGGCSATAILGAVGLELRDLFRPRNRPPLTPRERRDAWQSAGWAAALRVLGREVPIVLSAAATLKRGERLSPADYARLAVAHDRVRDAMAVLA